MKIAIQAMVQPYTYQDLDSIIKIADAALDKGHEVTIFLFCDAALASNKQIKPVRSDRNLPKILETMIKEKGLKVDICGICMDYRGITTDMIIEGSRASGLPELAELVYNSDRFISFMA
ncbi:oxidoreductase DsrE [Tepiditoga spiralis]|uniref:Oxidoreductase DsrE n=1 Tax=Tepiditoga spiralis TaxID=2108365 RepID=A0A7G1G908_9BACT|nr:DsrE family protein [Tepiditoga spiralis]BBE31457.1 oxidoreductase DsrE [Tepiditoga spiralis]